MNGVTVAVSQPVKAEGRILGEREGEREGGRKRQKGNNCLLKAEGGGAGLLCSGSVRKYAAARLRRAR